MDLRLYARVLWRFRLLVAIGTVLAATLALLAAVRIGPSGIAYRQSELWSSSARLLVTQNGFPEGRLYAQKPTQPGKPGPTAGEQAARLGIPVADPARFNSLAILYAELATSDQVRQLVNAQGAIRGRVVATSLRDDQSGVLLPLIDLTAIATTPRDAIGLAERTATALDTYLANEQKANGVPASDRAIIQTIERPRRALLFQPRPKTLPVVVFLAVMLASIGLAFLLENMRPRSRPSVAATEESELRPAERRRTAWGP